MRVVVKKLKRSLRLIVPVALIVGAAWAFSGVLQSAQALDPAIIGAHYRLYETSNTTTPGSPLAATSTAAQLSTAGQSFRMRTGLTTRPDSIEITKVIAGTKATCAIVSGLVYCAGTQTTVGLLGNNTGVDSNVMTPVDTSTGLAGKTVTDIAISPLGNNYIYVCVVADGLVYCWGSNTYNTLGNGQTSGQISFSPTPVQTVMDGSLTGETVKAIESGDGHVCGVTDSGKAFCWGTGGNGRLGDGTTSSRPKPTPVTTAGILGGKTVTEVGVGSGLSCAIADGAAYCWGAHYLGDGTANQSITPIAVDTSGVLAGKTLTEIDIAGNTTCVLDTDGKLYCWGGNIQGMVTDGTADPVLLPYEGNMVNVTGGALKNLSMKQEHGCAIGVSDLKPYCWGQNGYYATLRSGVQTGLTIRPTKASDVAAIASKSIADISSGQVTTCGVTTDGVGFCAGLNSYGNLGVGNTTNPINAPTAIIGTNFVPAQGVTVPANTIGTRLEFAAKSAGSCAAQTTGFAPVTTSSAIAWSVNGSVASGSAISASGNDPFSGSTTTLERYVSASADLNNPNAIPAGDSGLWDFSLRDNSGLFNQAYCLRLAHSNGTAYEAYTAYPEITTAQGVLSIDVVNGSSVTVPAPSFTLPSLTVSTACQNVSGTLGTSTQKIRVNNDTTAPGWSVSLAATAGATAIWQDQINPYSYDYNDSSGSPAGCNSGFDGDGVAGQLTVNPNAGGSVITPKSGCSNTGISKGTQQAFIQGSVSAVTLMSASSGTSLHCYWDMTGITLTQQIPPSQPAGTYTLDVTMTVLAQ